MKNIILVLVAIIIVSTTSISVSADWDDDPRWALTDEDPNHLVESFEFDTNEDLSSGVSLVRKMESEARSMESTEKEYTSEERKSVDEQMAKYATGQYAEIYRWIIGD